MMLSEFFRGIDEPLDVLFNSPQPRLAASYHQLQTMMHCGNFGETKDQELTSAQS